MQLHCGLKYVHIKYLTFCRPEKSQAATVTLRVPVTGRLEEVCQSGHKSLGDQLVNSLTRVVVIVPHSRCPVRVRGCDVAVKAERGGVVKDLPEVGSGVEGLSSDAGVAGLEVIKLGGELRVE